MIPLNVMYTYDDIIYTLKELSDRYSKILKYQVIGTSHDLRNIPMVSLGSGQEHLILTGGVHGRESINPVVMVHMLEEYCVAYTKNQWIDDTYDMKELLSHYTISMIPLLNPDGYMIALKGFQSLRSPILRQSAKMMGIPYEEWKLNGRGVDINRNFPCNSYIKVHAVDKPLSEQETKALVQLFLQKDTCAYLDFHSRGNIIYYYRNAMPEDYNKKSYGLASELQKACGYDLGSPEEELLTVASGGNTVQFYSEYFGKPAITIETLEDEAPFPLSVSFQEDVVEKIRLLPLITLQYLNQGQRNRD